MRQQSLLDRPDPLITGLYHRYAQGYYIDHAAWMRAANGGELVGACRHCGGQLAPWPAEQVGDQWWYEASCLACGKSVAAPGGRILLRSSRHTEQPTKWRDERATVIKK